MPKETKTERRVSLNVTAKLAILQYMSEHQEEVKYMPIDQLGPKLYALPGVHFIPNQGQVRTTLSQAPSSMQVEWYPPRASTTAGNFYSKLASRIDVLEERMNQFASRSDALEERMNQLEGEI